MVSESLRHLLADSEDEEEHALHSQVQEAVHEKPLQVETSTEEAGARLLLSLASPPGPSSKSSPLESQSQLHLSTIILPSPATTSPSSSSSSPDYHQPKPEQQSQDDHHHRTIIIEDMARQRRLVPTPPPQLQHSPPLYSGTTFILNEISHLDSKLVCEYVSRLHVSFLLVTCSDRIPSLSLLNLLLARLRPNENITTLSTGTSGYPRSASM